MQKHQHPNKHDSSAQETSGHHRSTCEPLERLHFVSSHPFFTLSITLITDHSRQDFKSAINQKLHCRILFPNDDPESLINDYAIHSCLEWKESTWGHFRPVLSGIAEVLKFKDTHQLWSSVSDSQTAAPQRRIWPPLPLSIYPPAQCSGSLM